MTLCTTLPKCSKHFPPAPLNSLRSSAGSKVEEDSEQGVLMMELGLEFATVEREKQRKFMDFVFVWVTL